MGNARATRGQRVGNEWAICGQRVETCGQRVDTVLAARGQRVGTIRVTCGQRVDTSSFLLAGAQRVYSRPPRGRARRQVSCFGRAACLYVSPAQAGSSPSFLFRAPCSSIRVARAAGLVARFLVSGALLVYSHRPRGRACRQVSCFGRAPCLYASPVRLGWLHSS